MLAFDNHPKYCIPRYVAIGLMLQLTPMSLPAIGRRLAGRDHTTIVNGRNRLAVLLEGEAFRNRFEQIKQGLSV
jgi:chromosomal replication initiation ATPase DnaA